MAKSKSKDVAVTMGIVPENEHLLGLEGAGIVRRVAKDVTRYKPGDRVVVFEKGTFANRIQVTTERTHHILDDLAFEVSCRPLNDPGGLANKISGRRHYCRSLSYISLLPNQPG
jgi:threonine dehydrogenase-like Zn-dependent dehydrogenase